MQITTSVLLLSALSAGALAQPSHRRHQHFHEKRAVGDMVTAVIDGVTVSWENTYSGETATPEADGVEATAETTASATATATATSVASSASTTAASETSGSSTASASSSSSTGSVSTFTEFCASSSSKKRATTAEIAYTGDTGTSTDWGCNQLLIDSDLVDDYNYTAAFTLDDSNTEDWKCVCWNKIGPDGGINGWFGYSAVSFTLSPGDTQVVAYDGNTQGGCSCGEGSVPTDDDGEWAGTWLEFDMGNTSNDEWSGADISALVAQASDMTVQGMKVTEGSDCDSSIDAGGETYDNAYVSGTEDDDGIGCNLSPGDVHLTVTVGWS